MNTFLHNTQDNNSFPNNRLQAAKSLNNYLSQLKQHFDCEDEDIIKILENVLKEKKSENFLKKCWRIFQ